jgi:hypothetical protein
VVLPVGLQEVEAVAVEVTLAQDPSPTATATLSMPSAACSWLPLRAHVIVMVTVGAVWARFRLMARATSSPAFAGAPLGFWGAPQPPPMEVAPAPLPLSKVATGWPSTAMV